MKRAGDESIWPSKTKKSDNSEHIFVNYFAVPPSLQRIATVAVAVKLWGYPDNEELGSDGDSDEEGDYPKLDRRWRNKLDEISLPDSLKQQISCTIRPIAIQWICWLACCDVYAKYCNLNELYKVGYLSYWTNEGKLDQLRLLEDISNKAKEVDVEVDFTALYENACTYCLEESLTNLWIKVSSNKDINVDNFANGSYLQHDAAYWTASFTNELPNLIQKFKQYDESDIYDLDLSIGENMVSSCIVAGNPVGVRYFWSKLTEREKWTNIEKWVILVMETTQYEYFDVYNEDFFNYLEELFVYQYYNPHTDIMCFLLSHLQSEMKQKEIFQAYDKVVLRCLFSHWPYQQFFLPTITVMFDFLEEDVYIKTMSKVADSIKQRGTELLLRELWDASPPNLKKEFLHFLTNHAKAIIQLLSVGDHITVDMILNYASVEEKKRIVFQMIHEPEFVKFVYSNEFAFSAIDRLTSRALTSDCTLQLFKHCVMMAHARNLSRRWICDKNSLAVDKMINWCSPSLDEMGEFKQSYNNIMNTYKSLIFMEDYEKVKCVLNRYFETEDET